MMVGANGGGDEQNSEAMVGRSGIVFFGSGSPALEPPRSAYVTGTPLNPRRCYPESVTGRAGAGALAFERRLGEQPQVQSRGLPADRIK